jgi:hypothetical protein
MSCLEDLNNFYDFYAFTISTVSTIYRSPLTARSALSLSKGLPLTNQNSLLLFSVPDPWSW